MEAQKKLPTKWENMGEPLPEQGGVGDRRSAMAAEVENVAAVAAGRRLRCCMAMTPLSRQRRRGIPRGKLRLRDTSAATCGARSMIGVVKAYIAAGKPDNGGEQRLARLESMIS